MNYFGRYQRYLLALGLTLALVQVAWIKIGSFFGLAGASLFGVFAVAWALKSTQSAWPLPPPEPAQPATALKPPSAIGITLLLAGIAFICLALSLALQDQLAWSLAAVAAGACCWRPELDLRPEPGLSRRTLAGLMLAIMLTGAVFRFYKAGEIPAGMLTVDEPRLMLVAGQILDGKRATYYVEGAEGYAPWWVEAAAMWLFGRDITGFRMSCLIPGLILVGLVGMLALELVGSRLGLLAAGLTAVCVWPVTFSRSEYIVASSLLPVVAAPWLFLRGLRRGKNLELCLSGFCVGLSFNVYTPGRLTCVLLGLLAFYVWFRRPAWRPSLRRAWMPLAGGLVVGLAPLLLWAAPDPGYAFRAYFGKLNWGMIAGESVVQAPGMVAKMEMVLGNILPGLPQLFTMFTTHGGIRPWFFKLDQPVVDQATLFLMLCGLAVSLIRFRQPAYAFVVTWWLLGLTPTLLASPQYHMDERRIMVAMPATMLLAAMGLHGLLGLGTRNLRRVHADRAMLALALGFFAFLGAHCWHIYFHDIELDRTREDYSYANFDNMLRGIFTENNKSPVSVLSYRPPNDQAWYGSNPENEQIDHWNVLGPIPHQVVNADGDYLGEGGLSGALRGLDLSGGRDPLVVLTPFHYYLEPFLVGQLGGTQVADIAPVRTTDDIAGGFDYSDIGMEWDKTSFTRIVRLKNFNPLQLKALETRWLYPYAVQELEPPLSLGGREAITKLWLLSPEHIRALEDYDRDPRRWRAGKPVVFKVPDPWFCVYSSNFPGHPQLPFLLSAHWVLRIPADGLYALGASSTGYLTLSVDGRRVYTYIPRDRTEYDAENGGALGAPIALSAGDHRLDVSQLFLSSLNNSNSLIRLVWQRPGGDKETLPLEFLLPPAAAH
ncbi:MAG TPA: glycosyltransferase family 39 protein [bacterium]|nr:glycosyltransferase family 39 protein [bacterium]